MENKMKMSMAAIFVVAILIISSVLVMNLGEAASPPGAPTNLEATRGDGKVTLTWASPDDEGSDEISGYIIYRGRTGSNDIFINVDDVTSYVDEDVTNGIWYFYRVAAVNSAGAGEKGNLVQVMPSADPVTAPSIPRNLVATVGQSSVSLTWDAPADNGGAVIEYYELSYVKNGSSDDTIINVGIVFEHEITDLDEIEYEFSVVAVNSIGRSPVSKVAATPLIRSVENLNIGYVTTAGNTFGWSDMGTYLFRATVYQESLIGMDSDGNFCPRLADSWETSDAKTWTFHLTHNATWHDGVPFTAKDVFFSINYTLLKKPWGMNDAKFMLEIANVTMIDLYTIEIEMKTPYANLLNNVRIGLVVFPEHIYKFVNDPMTYGLPESQMNATVGTGPYKAVSLDTTARILKFTVYDDYYRGTPSLKNMTIRFYSNADSMMLALMNGEIDTVFGWGSGISYYYVSQLLADDDLGIILNPSLGVNALNFNNNKAPFNNYTLRLAVSYALDYASLRDIVQGGYGEIGSAGILPEDFPNYIETETLTTNVNTAKSLLDSLGYVDIDADGYREYPNGSKFQPLMILSSSTTWVRASEIIEDNLQKVGIDVQVKIVTSGFAAEKKKREYDMVLSGTSQAGTFAWESYYTAVTDGNGSLGDAQVFDPEFQALIVKLRNAATDEEMAEAAADVQNYYADNLPSLVLWWSQIIQPYNQKYTGFGFDLGFGTIMCYDTFFNLRST